MRKSWIVLSLALLSAGCYRATVSTGLEAADPTQRESRWVSSWIAGLIGPGDYEAADFCRGGSAATVETKHTFLNQLVAGLTAGIYTPMTITVTCARR